MNEWMKVYIGQLQLHRVFELAKEGRVDNRLSNNKVNHFVMKKK